MHKSLADAICQLQSIGCIISSENIWANVQDHEDPGLLDYNIENSRNWKPFLTESTRNKYFTPNKPIPTEQTVNLRYMRPMDEARAEVIAMKIQNYITDMFERQRINVNRMRTKWNNQMEETLKNILAMCENKRKKARQGATKSTLREKDADDGDF